MNLQVKKMTDYDIKHYEKMINSWKRRANNIREAKYDDWQSKIEDRMNEQSFDYRLAELLGIKDVSNLSQYGTKDRLIAEITGFKEKEIRKLRELPSDSRDLMFAFAYVLGYEYRIVTLEDGSFDLYDDELTEYFDDADMRQPDYRDINDYICICAAMYYKECNQDVVYGESQNSLITLKELQTNLRNQINAYILDLDEFENWQDFYAYYFDEKKVTNADIYKYTGLEDVDVNDWKKHMPKNAEELFMACICFEFNAIQTIHVFDKFWNKEGDAQRPDLTSNSDLIWLYLADNYSTLRKLHFQDQMQEVKDYYAADNLTKSKKLTILQYYEIFSQMEFTTERQNTATHDPKAKTLIVDDRNDLAELAVVSDYDRVFIHVKDGRNPVKNAPTGISLGSRMDVLHAGDPARILWYRINAADMENDEEQDLIRDIYYRKQPDQKAENMAKGARFLNDWIADNSVNAYLTKCFDAPDTAQTITWNTYITNLLLEQKYPNRKDLIALGVILSLPKEGINELLDCYGYQALSQHDLTELILIKILDEIGKTFPFEFKFYAPYTANRLEIDHGIQNIGNRRKAKRKKGLGYNAMLYKWHKKWFEDYQRRKLKTVYHPVFVEGKTSFEVKPSEFIDGWSIRRHVMWCLMKADLGTFNWLYQGLSNPLNPKDDYPFEKVEYNR